MNVFLDTAAGFFLFFTRDFVIAPLSIIGFISHKRTWWGQALLLLFFTMVLNTFLKSFFQIPLPPHLPADTFAFPSGHMQTTFVFYGWLYLKTSSRLLRSILFIGILGVGFALIYKGYHTLFDIAGAVGFGFLVLVAGHFLFRTKRFLAEPYKAGLPLGSLMVCMMLLLPSLKFYVWLAFYGLAGFSFGWWVSSKMARPQAGIFLPYLFVCAGIALIAGIFSVLSPHLRDPFFNLQVFFMAAWVPIAASCHFSRVSLKPKTS